MAAGDGGMAVGASDLARAIEEDELSLLFQPKVDLASGDVVGVEALARWCHPRLGPISPAVFIPLAEGSDLIHPFTRWVLEAALRQWSLWQQNGTTTSLAVNVSARNLDRLDFPDLVAELCQAASMPCRYLTLELTESATQNAVRLLDTLTRMRIKGMRTSLDDFGTGYSSLVQLHQLPFSELKIDRSFVTAADKVRDSRVIVKSVIDLARNLEMDVVAEGVETPEVRDLLLGLGCETAQGYFFGRPLEGSLLFQAGQPPSSPAGGTAAA